MGVIARSWLTAAEGIIAHDKGDIPDVNAAVVRLLGFAQADVVAMRLEELFAEGCRDEVAVRAARGRVDHRTGRLPAAAAR